MITVNSSTVNKNNLIKCISSIFPKTLFLSYFFFLFFLFVQICFLNYCKKNIKREILIYFPFEFPTEFPNPLEKDYLGFTVTHTHTSNSTLEALLLRK